VDQDFHFSLTCDAVENPLRVYQEVLLIVTKIVSPLDPKHKDKGLLELLRLDLL